MRYDFLIDTYETERLKVISAWSMFTDDDLPVRPNASDTRGRSFHEHMVHQCDSEDIWFRTMLDIDAGAPPLPKQEVRLEFIRRYEEDSGKRLTALRNKEEAWWEGETTFFDVRRSRAWVLTRRIAHTRKVQILERDETMGDVLKRRTAKGKTLRVKFGPCNVVLLPFWNAFTG